MNILISGCSVQVKEIIFQKLSSENIKVFVMANESDPLPIPASEIDIVVCNNLFLYHDISQFHNLVFIQAVSAGLDRLPIKDITNMGIILKNAADIYSIPIAEFVICGILNIYKKNETFRKQQKEHLWTKHRDLCELFEKNICIFGCGNIGTAIAKRLKSFGCHVTGIDNKKIISDFYDNFINAGEFVNCASDFDVVVCSLPLNEHTFNFFNMDLFSKMNKNAIFVNISRGAVVNQQHLIDALKTNQIGYAIIDVFDKEPLEENNELWDLENAILTPHNSFVGDGNDRRLVELIIKNLKEGGYV